MFGFLMTDTGASPMPVDIVLNGVFHFLSCLKNRIKRRSSTCRNVDLTGWQQGRVDLTMSIEGPGVTRFIFKSDRNLLDPGIDSINRKVNFPFDKLADLGIVFDVLDHYVDFHDGFLNHKFLVDEYVFRSDDAM